MGYRAPLGRIWLRAGFAVVNGSRGAWSIIRQVFPSAVAVEINVDPDVLAQRLEGHGARECFRDRGKVQRALALETESRVTSPSTIRVIHDRDSRLCVMRPRFRLNG